MWRRSGICRWGARRIGRLDDDECDHSDGKISDHQTPINVDSFFQGDFRIHDKAPPTWHLSLLFA